MACSYKPPYRRALRLKAFLAHLQTLPRATPSLQSEGERTYKPASMK
jgi:hypothetical protein